MGVLIKATGTITEIQPKNGHDYSLEELQGFVGGLIELVTFWHEGKIKYAVVNDEGLIMNLPCNLVASLVVGQDLVGDCAIVDINEIE